MSDIERGLAEAPSASRNAGEHRERRRLLHEQIVEDRSWRRDRTCMAAILRDPALGAETASALASDLPWRLVAEAALDARVSAAVRQRLDEGLARRVDGLASGERLAIARIAGPETRRALAALDEAAVLEALARNPRLLARERARLRARLVARRVASQPRRDDAEDPR